MNYMGGKFRLLDQILPCLPDHIGVFVDLFAGGLDVSLNTAADTVRCNDANSPVIALYERLQATPVDLVLAHVDGRIDEFGLSKTNTDGYLRLRRHYNSAGEPLDLFVLAAFAFNHQVRFNLSGEFNTPFGRHRSAFNPGMRQGLVDLTETVQRRRFLFSDKDFRDVAWDGVGQDGFVYADPPYLITTGTYNDGRRGYGGWGPDDDRALFALLDGLDDAGVPFALSNVLHHKGASNRTLADWARRYRTVPLQAAYRNANARTSAAAATTAEVLVTNVAAAPGSPAVPSQRGPLARGSRHRGQTGRPQDGGPCPPATDSRVAQSGRPSATAVCHRRGCGRACSQHTSLCPSASLTAEVRR